MSVTTSLITIDQRDRILFLQESHFQDLKGKLIKPGKLTRSISAFANADGGELYVGIEEDKQTGTRTWDGFDNQEAANGHIQAIEGMFPLGQDVSYEFLNCRGCQGLVLRITLQKATDIVRASDGVIYRRRGAQNLQVVSPEGVERLRLNKGITTFENQTFDVDASIIIQSETMQRFMRDIVPTAEASAWLPKQLLVRNGKPTVACIVLFADEPQAILPKRCGIKIYRYKTRDAEGTRETLAFNPISIEGPLYDQIKAAVQKTVRIIEDIAVLGSEGLEMVKYPTEALHEIITNAVLHRDYSILNDVHVRIFDNRIEVESPGLLAGHVTVQNILQEQFARNGTLVRLVNKFPDPPNKDVGEGLNTAFEAMRNLKLKDPLVEQRENSVVVHIRHEPLASPEEMVMEYLQTHEYVNNRTGRKICHIGSENVMKRVFERLMALGLIERVPGLHGKATAYRNKTNPTGAALSIIEQVASKPRPDSGIGGRTLWSDVPSEQS